jgi:hypothetical protein
MAAGQVVVIQFGEVPALAAQLPTPLGGTLVMTVFTEQLFWFAKPLPASVVFAQVCFGTLFAVTVVAHVVVVQLLAAVDPDAVQLATSTFAELLPPVVEHRVVVAARPLPE